MRLSLLLCGLLTVISCDSGGGGGDDGDGDPDPVIFGVAVRVANWTPMPMYDVRLRLVGNEDWEWQCDGPLAADSMWRVGSIPREWYDIAFRKCEDGQETIIHGLCLHPEFPQSQPGCTVTTEEMWMQITFEGGCECPEECQARLRILNGLPWAVGQICIRRVGATGRCGWSRYEWLEPQARWDVGPIPYGRYNIQFFADIESNRLFSILNLPIDITLDPEDTPTCLGIWDDLIILTLGETCSAPSDPRDPEWER